MLVYGTLIFRVTTFPMFHCRVFGRLSDGRTDVTYSLCSSPDHRSDPSPRIPLLGPKCTTRVFAIFLKESSSYRGPRRRGGHGRTNGTTVTTGLTNFILSQGKVAETALEKTLKSPFNPASQTDLGIGFLPFVALRASKLQNVPPTDTGSGWR